jgi:hypothetical protein
MSNAFAPTPVSDSQVDDLQTKNPKRNVRMVLRKFMTLKGRAPSLVELVRWVATETDPTTLADTRPARTISDPTCQQCDGTGFVKTVRRYNGVEMTGRLYTTHADRDGVTQRKLVRCDHQTLHVDPRHGEELTLNEWSN